MTIVTVTPIAPDMERLDKLTKTALELLVAGYMSKSEYRRNMKIINNQRTELILAGKN